MYGCTRWGGRNSNIVRIALSQSSCRLQSAGRSLVSYDWITPGLQLAGGGGSPLISPSPRSRGRAEVIAVTSPPGNGGRQTLMTPSDKQTRNLFPPGDRARDRFPIRELCKCHFILSRARRFSLITAPIISGECQK